MTFNDFRSRLRKLNSRIVCIAGRGRIAGIYLYMPKHELSNPETGLKHLGGMPSPFFTTLPKYSFWDDALGGFNKGTDGVLRSLTEWRFAGKPVLNRSEAIREFGYFPPTFKVPTADKPEWVAKKRLKAKYQLQANKDNGQMMGQGMVTA